MLTNPQLQNKRRKKTARRAGLRTMKRRFQALHGDSLGEKLYRQKRDKDIAARAKRGAKP